MNLHQIIRKSFQNVKKDISEIKDKLQMLTENQEKLEASLQSMQEAAQTNNLVQIRDVKKASKTKKKQN